MEFICCDPCMVFGAEYCFPASRASGSARISTRDKHAIISGSTHYSGIVTLTTNSNVGLALTFIDANGVML